MTDERPMTPAERVNAGDLRIFGGRIAWRAPMFEHSQCWSRLLLGYGNLLDQSTVGDALVDRARSVIATAFLRSDCEVLLTIDDDIIFDPRDALTICAAAVDRDIVCGVYPTRSQNLCMPAAMLLRDTPVEFVAGHHTLVEILWGASGFMAVHRRVFEKLAQRADMPLLHATHPLGNSYHPFYIQDVEMAFEGGENIERSEDYAFCNRAREEGFTVYADTGIRLGHIGTKVYTMGDIVGEPDYQGRVRITRENGPTGPVFKKEWDAPTDEPASGLVLPSGAMVREKQPRSALVAAR